MSTDPDAAGWIWDPAALTVVLEAAGFDVEPSGAHTRGGGGFLAARRERGDRVLVLKVDAGGRVRVSSTTLLDESSRRLDAAGVPCRMIATLQRGVRLVAALPDAARFAAFLAALDLLSWDDETGSGEERGGVAPDGPW